MWKFEICSVLILSWLKLTWRIFFSLDTKFVLKFPQFENFMCDMSWFRLYCMLMIFLVFSTEESVVTANDKNIARLMEMGFTADQALNALAVSNGDLLLAVNYLMGHRVSSQGWVLEQQKEKIVWFHSFVWASKFLILSIYTVMVHWCCS